MSKSIHLKFYYVKEILERETDYEHGITMNRIIELIHMRGCKVERKSVYSDIELLQNELGMDIQRPSGSDKLYKLMSRDFEVEELIWIVQALFAYEPLPKEKALPIARKLYSLCSRRQEKFIREQVAESMK